MFENRIVYLYSLRFYFQGVIKRLNRGEPEGDALDLMSVKEEEFEKLVNYIAPDLPTNPNCPNRAENSLPRNLELRPSRASNDVGFQPSMFSSSIPLDKIIYRILFHLRGTPRNIYAPMYKQKAAFLYSQTVATSQQKIHVTLKYRLFSRLLQLPLVGEN